jgi:competence protein ComEA
MTGARMRWGGAALALLVVVYYGSQWYRGNRAPPVTYSQPVEPRTAAAATPAPASPVPAPAAAAPLPSASATVAEASPPPAEAATLTVHVVGAVRKPDVYRLPAKARLNDALRAAGGPRAGADLEAVNLASFVQDGEQIRVPTLAERRALRIVAPLPVRAVPRGGMAPRPVRTTARYPLAARPAASPSRPGEGSAPTVSPNGPVNINTAGAEELDTLPGVGPSTAAAILEFRREHGPFQRIEDLLEVRGIGEKKLAGMRDRIVLH